MSATLGLNEALILAALTAGEATIAQVAERLESRAASRTIADGTIFVALARMEGRGFVVSRKVSALSADGRTRLIGFYEITRDGAAAVGNFEREALAVSRLRTALAGA